MSQNKRDRKKGGQPDANEAKDNNKNPQGMDKSSAKGQDATPGANKPQSQEGTAGEPARKIEESGRTGGGAAQEASKSKSAGEPKTNVQRDAERPEAGQQAGSEAGAASKPKPGQEMKTTAAAAPQDKAGKDGKSSSPAGVSARPGPVPSKTSTSSTATSNTRAAASSAQGAGGSSSRPSTGGTGGSGGSGRPPASKSSDHGGRGLLGLVLAVIALIIAVIAVLGVGGLWYEGQQQIASLDSHIGAVEKGQQGNFQKVIMPKLSSMGDRVDDLSSKVSHLDGSLDKRQQRVERLEKAVKNVQQQNTTLSEQLGGEHNRFVEQRISLLLEAANQRLQINHDPQGAARALTLADHAIRNAGDPALHPVREKIADEVGKLKSLPNPDIEGLSLRLSRLIKEVPDLKLANSIPANYHPQSNGKNGGNKQSSENKGNSGSTGEQIAEGWHHFLDTAGAALSKMVTVRKGDTAGSGAPPLLSPKQSYFLTQNLQLQLRAARLALLGGYTKTYHDAINEADDWIKQYFDTDDSDVSATLDQLKDLSKVKMTAKTPDISGSLDSLRRIMRHKRLNGGKNGGNEGQQNNGQSGHQNSDQSGEQSGQQGSGDTGGAQQNSGNDDQAENS